jgi:O-antigen ligase
VNRRTIAFRILLSILPCAVLLAALATSGTPLLARLLIVGIGLVTLWNPAAGLLITAGLAPLGAFLIALDGVQFFRLTEVIVLSFIAMWLIRPSIADGPRLPRYAWIAAWLFSVLLISLCFGLSRQLLRYPDALRVSLETVAGRYFAYGDPTGYSDAARMIEGFALVCAAMELIRRRPSLARSLPVALATSAMIAAAATVFLWFGIGPKQILSREAAIGYRFAAHVLDLNAAGSHFAMVLCLALGIAMRERGRRRAFWIFASAACAFGLWMSGSRSGEAAAGLVIPAAFLWMMTGEWPRRRRIAVIGGVLGVLLVFGLVRAWQIERDPTYTASGFRQQFMMSSFRVIGTHPYLGIGPGRYYRDSPNFLTPQLAWAYGSENAHNNFLQVTTEEGIIGFFIYATFVAGAIGLAFRGLSPRSRDVSAVAESAKADWRLLGAVAGVIAFLGTCLMGHPLLVPEVAAAFFVQLALAASLGGSNVLNENVRSVRLQPDVDGPPDGGHSRRSEWGAALAGTIVLAVLPAWTLEKPLMPVHLEEVDGMYYADEGAVEDLPFHWTREYGTVYARATDRVIELPLRSPIAALTRTPTLVEITVGGRTLVNQLVGEHWTTVRLNLPSPEPPLLFNRISLKVNHTARVADLIPGSNDQRVVGVQVANYNIIQVAWEFVPKPAVVPQ